jgi:hypothetical protein
VAYAKISNLNFLMSKMNIWIILDPANFRHLGNGDRDD